MEQWIPVSVLDLVVLMRIQCGVRALARDAGLTCCTTGYALALIDLPSCYSCLTLLVPVAQACAGSVPGYVCVSLVPWL